MPTTHRQLGSLVPATAPIILGALHRLEGGGEDKGLAVEEMGVIKHVPGTTSKWSSPWFHLEAKFFADSLEPP